MITNYGKQIVAKYLAGQVTSPFSYVALGSGATPIEPAAETGLESTTRLVSESIRVPVDNIAVGVENDETYLSVSAVVPAAQRYEFSEIGIYTAAKDTEIDSRTDTSICNFARGEGWQVIDGGVPADIDYFDTLDGDTEGNLDSGASEPGYTDTTNEVYAFFADSGNSYFSYSGRSHCSARNLSDVLAVTGGLSVIANSAGTFDESSSDRYLSAPISVDLSGHKASDELVLAFVVLQRDYTAYATAPAPDYLKILIEFKEDAGSADYARFEVLAQDSDGDSNTAGAEPYDFAESGYATVKNEMNAVIATANDSKSNVRQTANFSWANVGIVNIWIEAYVNASPGSQEKFDFYVLLDSLQFVSNNTSNPNYGLVAYSVVQNSATATIKKYDGERARVDYRIGLSLPS